MIEPTLVPRPRAMAPGRAAPWLAALLALAACVSCAHRASTPPPEAAPPSQPRPERERPPVVTRDGSPPAFGDYVYVEELPEPIQRAVPNYPEAARRAGISGIVQVQALVLRDGSVGETRVVKSIPMLDQAAIDCVRQWRFKPALSKGEPVAVWVGIPIRFEP